MNDVIKYGLLFLLVMLIALLFYGSLAWLISNIVKGVFF